MAIFLIVPTETRADSPLEQVIDQHSMNYYALPAGEFLVSFAGTSRQLSDLLGISEGHTDSAIVAAISSYYGRTSTDTWEWISANWDR